MVERSLERAAIEIAHGIEAALHGGQEATLAVRAGLIAQHEGAHHRRRGQRDDQRYSYGHRQGDREFAECSPDQSPHEQDGQKHRHQRQAHRQDRESDLACTEQRRLDVRHACLDVARNVLQHDDCIVDHESRGYG